MEEIITQKHPFLSSIEESYPYSTQENEYTWEFPTLKTEEWRYTSTKHIQSQEWKFLKDDNVKNVDNYKIENTTSIVIVNGFYREDLSDNVSAFKILERENSKGSNNPKHIFESLNLNYPSLILEIDINDDLTEPIHLIYINTKQLVFSNPQLHIKVAKNKEAKIIASVFSIDNSNSLFNIHNYIELEANAHLSFYSIQDVKAANIYTNIIANQEKDSTLKTYSLFKSAAWNRNNILINQNGSNCQTFMYGTFNTNNDQHVDNQTLINHLHANCYSEELYKGVLDGKSTAVFNGKVIVHKDAQKINAYQSNANILISEKATMNSKPELEIYADDVKCSHGSTTGQLDNKALYYLRSRGISKTEAQKILIESFVGEVYDNIDIPEVKNLFVKED